MTEQINAFPTSKYNDFPYEYGMTLRDYFAAKAMQAYITSQINMTSEDTSIFAEEIVAKISYQFADAMLKERESKQ